MDERLRSVLTGDPRFAFALLFGSAARGPATPFSDLDVAIGLEPGTPLDVQDIGELTSQLEQATGSTIDLAILDEAPPALAYRIFRDGRLLFERNRPARLAAQARAVLEYLDFKPVEEFFTEAVLRARAVVDETVRPAKIASIRDAVQRIREVLPSSAAEFTADRAVREIVVLNLFVAIQESLALATHYLADAGRTVPGTYGQVFLALADAGTLPTKLAQRLAAAAGFRNLVAYQDGAIDAARVFAIASQNVDDLLELCRVIAGAGHGIS